MVEICHENRIMDSNGKLMGGSYHIINCLAKNGREEGVLYEDVTISMDNI